MYSVLKIAPRRAKITLLIKTFHKHQLNPRTFPVFPGATSNSRRFPGFSRVVDTLYSQWLGICCCMHEITCNDWSFAVNRPAVWNSILTEMLTHAKYRKVKSKVIAFCGCIFFNIKTQSFQVIFGISEHVAFVWLLYAWCTAGQRGSKF